MTRARRRHIHRTIIQHMLGLFELASAGQLEGAAVVGAIERAVADLNALAREVGEVWTLRFDGRDVFLNGNPLMVERGVYDEASSIGEMWRGRGVHEILIGAPVVASDLLAIMTHHHRRRPLQVSLMQLTPRVWLRQQEAAAAANLGGAPSHQDLVVRTCAAALVAVERFYEGIKRGDYSGVLTVKRIARNLVLASRRQPRHLLAILSWASEHSGVVTLAVKSAIVAMTTLAHITDDLRNLVDITLAALLFDLGAIRAGRLMHQAETQGLPDLPALSDEALERLPAATASVTAVLGGLGESALARSVMVYEAHALAQGSRSDVLYDGAIAPTLEARILVMSRAFLRELARSDRRAKRDDRSRTDRALETVRQRLESEREERVFALIMRALGLTPRLSCVRLTSGWEAVLLANHERPSCFKRPLVKLVRDPDGRIVSPMRDIDLSLPSERAARLGAIATTIEDPHPALATALDGVTPATDDGWEDLRRTDDLAIMESLSAVRKAPFTPPDEQHTSILDVGPELEEISSATGPASRIFSDDSRPIAISDDTAGSDALRSDSMQMLNVADIAHMVPEELANQHYEALDHTEAVDEAEAGEDSLLGEGVTSGPLSMHPETWHRLHEELDEDDDLDAPANDTTSLHGGSDNMMILSEQIDLEELSEAFEEEHGGGAAAEGHDEREDADATEITSASSPQEATASQATTLLPAEIIDALQVSDRREWAERSEAIIDDAPSDDDPAED